MFAAGGLRVGAGLCARLGAAVRIAGGAFQGVPRLTYSRECPGRGGQDAEGGVPYGFVYRGAGEFPAIPRERVAGESGLCYNQGISFRFADFWGAPDVSRCQLEYSLFDAGWIVGENWRSVCLHALLVGRRKGAALGGGRG